MKLSSGPTTLSEFFDESCCDIQQAYDELNYKRGWSFLYTPKKTFHPAQTLLFLGLNPGGREENYPNIRSVEGGNAYLCEDWPRRAGMGTWGAGMAPLQRQVQALFRNIHNKMKSNNHGYKEFMNSSLSANFVPFRSPSWGELHNKVGALAFASKVWGDVLAKITPRVVISISKPVHSAIRRIYCDQGFEVTSEQNTKIGWRERRDVTYSLVELIKEQQSVVLLRLPHLFRHKVFSSPKCESQIESITTKLAEALAPP